MIKLPPHDIIGIDPGATASAWVCLRGEYGAVDGCGKEDNEDLLVEFIPQLARTGAELVVEMVQPYGISVGQEVLDTAYWAGRFVQKWPFTSHLVRRGDVKRILFGKVAGIRDADVRDYCIQQFGRDRSEAVGTKKKPGPLCGIKADCWQALGVALAWVVQEQGR